ncbi:uncharacterized protein [Montipora capricornis]|uniref:uncharacterized protein n=1 Tax=Montipora capricornis TaxID=246305 RepID=UPI0035F1EE9B
MKQQFYFLRSADSFEDKVKGLHPPKDICNVDKEDDNELSKRDGLLGSHEANQKRVRFQQTDSLNMIVEIQSLDARSSSNEPKEFQDDEVKMICRQIDGNQPIKDDSQGHVTSTNRHLEGRTDQSVSQEFPDNLPPWKRQVLFNRKLKEKAMEKAQREKREIQERQWIGVAPWKIPLLAKQEKERLKEEQRWVGMPEWKKHLLARKGSGQIYRDYNAGNSIKTTRSTAPQIQGSISP